MKVLVALDETPTSLHAASVVARLLGPLGAEFLVVNVAQVPVPWVAASHGFGAVMPLQLDVADDEHRAELEEAMAARADAAALPVSDIDVVAGDPVTEICAAADRHDADLVVVGSHDRSALSRLLDPSVSTGVVRATSRPVLVVPDEG